MMYNPEKHLMATPNMQAEILTVQLLARRGKFEAQGRQPRLRVSAS